MDLRPPLPPQISIKGFMAFCDKSLDFPSSSIVRGRGGGYCDGVADIEETGLETGKIPSH